MCQQNVSANLSTNMQLCLVEVVIVYLTSCKILFVASLQLTVCIKVVGLD